MPATAVGDRCGLEPERSRIIGPAERGTCLRSRHQPGFVDGGGSAGDATLIFRDPFNLDR